jgi:hypothetical protein
MREESVYESVSRNSKDDLTFNHDLKRMEQIAQDNMKIPRSSGKDTLSVGPS